MFCLIFSVSVDAHADAVRMLFQPAGYVESEQLKATSEEKQLPTVIIIIFMACLVFFPVIKLILTVLKHLKKDKDEPDDPK